MNPLELIAYALRNIGRSVIKRKATISSIKKTDTALYFTIGNWTHEIDGMYLENVRYEVLLSDIKVVSCKKKRHN